MTTASILTCKVPMRVVALLISDGSPKMLTEVPNPVKILGEGEHVSFQDVLSRLTQAEAKVGDTVCVGSLEHLEQDIIWEEAVRVYNAGKKSTYTSIKEIPWHQGYRTALGLWRQLLDSVASLQARTGAHTLFFGKARIETVKLLDGGNFARYGIPLSDWLSCDAATLLRRKSDCVVIE